MKFLKKRSQLMLQQTGLYCARCMVRIGIGERQVTRDRKVFHEQCAAKRRQEACRPALP
jgi:hypothetical protein